ncbi:hypothetical protein MACH09_40230 [Vibrio sp. MACH09]|uniref:tetratricopeptide repeat protein n=1 Tax=Vibrio sp. MACH09 TaxID=3025122 RepID=UPI002794BF03|nr:tetratricopeptide repeat protein [Vibrio sp. MACH09]GLO63515.1 hypothetical protein MACH09_40230 [Vibrio sp. MACH09]
MNNMLKVIKDMYVINDSDWLDSLFKLLRINATQHEWQLKLDETLKALESEMQNMISILACNEEQLYQEANKRVTSFFINGMAKDVSSQAKVEASELLLRNKQPELALSVLQPLNMDSSSGYLINFGRALMQIGSAEQAYQCFINASKKSPESAEPYFHLGFHASLTGKPELSKSYYRQSIEKDAGHLGSLQNISYLYYQLEQFELAIRYANKALEVDEKCVGAYLAISACNNAMQCFWESLANIQTARDVCLDSITELDELEAIACFELQKYPRVIELIDRYLSLRPEATDMRLLRGRSLIELGKYSEALDDLDSLLAIDPYETGILEMRFVVLFFMEQWSEAEVAYVTLIKNAPAFKTKHKEKHSILRRNLALLLNS